MAFDIPLPKGVADVEPGGRILSAMRNINALTSEQLDAQKKALENQYYAPNIQSEMQLRQAQTQRSNQLLPYDITNQQNINQMYIPNVQADIAQKQAETEKINYILKHPGFMGGDEAKNIQYLIDSGIINPNTINQPSQSNYQNISPSNISSKNIPSSNIQDSRQIINPTSPFQTNNPLVNAILNKPYAQTAYQQRQAQGWDWVHTPTDAKSYEIAVGSGMGINPDEFINKRSQGQSLQDIARENGFDPNNLPDPDYLPTRGNIQQLKQRQTALNEMKVLDKFIKEGLGPYSRTVLGYSPAQISDALSGKNEDQQAKFLAARALAPESGNLRLLVAQARTGQGAIKMMMDKSLSNINTYQSLVSPKVYDKSQDLIENTLDNMFNAANKAYVVGKNKKSESQKSEPDEGIIEFIRDPNNPKKLIRKS